MLGRQSSPYLHCWAKLASTHPESSSWGLKTTSIQPVLLKCHQFKGEDRSPCESCYSISGNQHNILYSHPSSQHDGWQPKTGRRLYYPIILHLLNGFVSFLVGIVKVAASLELLYQYWCGVSQNQSCPDHGIPVKIDQRIHTINYTTSLSELYPNQQCSFHKVVSHDLASCLCLSSLDSAHAILTIIANVSTTRWFTDSQLCSLLDSMVTRGYLPPNSQQFFQSILHQLLGQVLDCAIVHIIACRSTQKSTDRLKCVKINQIDQIAGL